MCLYLDFWRNFLTNKLSIDDNVNKWRFLPDFCNFRSACLMCFYIFFTNEFLAPLFFVSVISVQRGSAYCCKGETPEPIDAKLTRVIMSAISLRKQTPKRSPELDRPGKLCFGFSFFVTRIFAYLPRPNCTTKFTLRFVRRLWPVVVFLRYDTIRIYVRSKADEMASLI